jgi:hypothetical protein
MKNYAMPAAIATVGLGLLSIGFNLNGNQANATPAAFNAGPIEPTIVWYDSHEFRGSPGKSDNAYLMLVRAWSDGTVEARYRLIDTEDNSTCQGVRELSGCDNTRGWFVVSSPNEGLNARADINFDERVDAADLGLLVAAWGDAPRNDYPPSDCPLGLIP